MYLKFILSRVNSLEHRVGGSPVYCMYICMCIYVYMCVCMCMCLCVCMCVYIYICICMCICNYISYLTLWKISLFFKLTLGPPITQLSYGWPSVWYTFVFLYLILWCVTVCLVSCMSYWNKSILSIESVLAAPVTYEFPRRVLHWAKVRAHCGISKNSDLCTTHEPVIMTFMADVLMCVNSTHVVHGRHMVWICIQF